MATPERFDVPEEFDNYKAPLADVIPLPVREAAPETPSPTPPVESVRLPNGDIRQTAFLVKDGLVRNWLRNSVVSKDMDPEEAVRVYKRWNPDPEFTIEALFI